MISTVESLIINRAKTLLVVYMLWSLDNTLNRGFLVEKALFLKGYALLDLLDPIRFHGSHRRL